ncbi:JmjC domain-containing histone demethylation protein 1 [Naganishia albida]|nr:JmjC domain-containing histone demethylation protein 1 [Naganishia albida]
MECVVKFMGIKWPRGLDIDTVARLLPPDHKGNVINNRSGARTWRTMPEWLAYIKHVSPTPAPIPDGRISKGSVTPQHYIFNMACLEITGTQLAKRITRPFLQQELDPMKRFPDALEDSNNPFGSLYVLSSKAGSFTPSHIDLAEVHWLAVVSEIKWVFLLSPTDHNLLVDKMAENGIICADLLWLPDLCAKTPVVKRVLAAGQALTIPSSYIHAVYTVQDSLALAGAWIHELNIKSHMIIRELEINLQALIANRYPQFERLCWLLAEEYATKLKATPITRPVGKHLLQQIWQLWDSIVSEAKKMKTRSTGYNRSRMSLPKGWRAGRYYLRLARELQRGYEKMAEKIEREFARAREQSQERERARVEVEEKREL